MELGFRGVELSFGDRESGFGDVELSLFPKEEACFRKGKSAESLMNRGIWKKNAIFCIWN
jgi:hypothetical protein